MITAGVRETYKFNKVECQIVIYFITKHEVDTFYLSL